MSFEGQPIHLTNAQRDDLQEIARSSALPARFVQGARIALLLADVVSARAVETKLDVSRPTIAKWRRRFLEHGVEGLTNRHRGRRPWKLTARLRARHKTKLVEAFLDEHPNVTLHFTPTYSSWLNQVELSVLEGSTGRAVAGRLHVDGGLGAEAAAVHRRLLEACEALPLEVCQPREAHHSWGAFFSDSPLVRLSPKVTATWKSGLTSWTIRSAGSCSGRRASSRSGSLAVSRRSGTG